MINLSGGCSEKDRISFYTKSNSITAIKLEDGKTKFEIEDTKKHYTLSLKRILAIIILFGIPSLIKTFILIPLIENKQISVIWYLISAFLYAIVTVSSIIHLRKEGGKEFLRNHGAEHMVYKAYKKLKRIPSMQECIKFSRIAKNCGVATYSAFITSQIIGFIIFVCTGFAIPETVLLLFPFFFNQTFPFYLIGNLAQFFTTRKPKPKNLRLAISALYVLEMLENHGKDIVTDINNGNHKFNIN